MTLHTLGNNQLTSVDREMHCSISSYLHSNEIVCWKHWSHNVSPITPTFLQKVHKIMKHVSPKVVENVLIIGVVIIIITTAAAAATTAFDHFRSIGKLG